MDLYTIVRKLRCYLFEGHTRTIAAKINVLISFVMKGGSILISLVLIPLTIHYITPTQYGVWLTLSSIIGWLNYFDVGIGNGLKNKLAEAISMGDTKLAKVYISTTYSVLSIIGVSLLITLMIINQFVDWTIVLNMDRGMEKELRTVVNIVLVVFCLQFVLQLINVISFSTQNVKNASIIGFLGSFLSLILVFLFIHSFPKGKLEYLCYSIGVSPIIVLFVASIILFKTSFKQYRPSIKLVDFSKIRIILTLGYKFFLIQIGQVLFFNTDNIIISRLIGVEHVVPYNIAYKYFNIITMLCGIIMTPFWPAFIEAQVKNDMGWIKKTVKKLEYISLLFLGGAFVMVLMSDFIYRMWVNDLVKIPLGLTITLAIYTVVNTYRTIFCSYINSTGKISVQVLLIFFSGIINIPLGIFLGRVFGVSGVILSTTILCIVCGIIEIIQYRKLIGGRAIGIWNR